MPDQPVRKIMKIVRSKFVLPERIIIVDAFMTVQVTQSVSGLMQFEGRKNNKVEEIKEWITQQQDKKVSQLLKVALFGGWES